MQLFKVYLIIFAAVLFVLLVSRFFPHTYKVERTIEINRPTEQVFAYMSNLKNWEEWSLWNRQVDSTLYYFYNQHPDTLGGRQYIRGELVGKGYFEITRYVPGQSLGFVLMMEHGDRTAAGTFTFEEVAGERTILHWTDSGDVGNNPIKRFMIPFVTDNTATTLDNGLAAIKQKAEARTTY